MWSSRSTVIVRVASAAQRDALLELAHRDVDTVDGEHDVAPQHARAIGGTAREDVFDLRVRVTERRAVSQVGREQRPREAIRPAREAATMIFHMARLACCENLDAARGEMRFFRA